MFRIVPQLTVKSVPDSIRFYVDRLGFKATVLDPQDEPVFASLDRDDATLFLVADGKHPPSGRTYAPRAPLGEGYRLYFEVDDARALYGELTADGILPLHEIAYNEKEDYTEFSIVDPDGYEIGVYS